MIERPVAVITGASRGIGKAIALELARTGYQLVLISKSESLLIDLSNSISIMPGCTTPVYFAADITNYEKVEKCIEKTIVDFGRINVLVNSAGIYYKGSSSLSLNDFRKLVETNLIAQFSLMNQVIPVMKKQQSGYIINIASRAGKTGLPLEGGYSASKFGLVGLSEALYRELSAFGISVTAVCPGWVETDMAFEAGTQLKTGEMIEPADVAKTVSWLLSLSENCRIKEIIIEPSKNIL